MTERNRSLLMICVHVPMCPRPVMSRSDNYVPGLLSRVRCVPVQLCPGSVVSRVRCVPGPMCPRSDVSPVRCVPGPMCPWHNNSYSLKLIYFPLGEISLLTDVTTLPKLMSICQLQTDVLTSGWHLCGNAGALAHLTVNTSS